MLITGLDEKKLAINIVKHRLDELDTAFGALRRPLQELLRALETEPPIPLYDLETSLDATDDGTMDLPPTLRPDADDAPEADGRSDGDPEGRALALAQEHQRVREKMAGRPEGWKVKEQVPGPHDANSVESDLPDPDDFVDRTPGAGA